MIQVGFKSDKGKNRSNNEDACFVLPKENIYMVADGVGGNNAGELASKTAVVHIADYVRNNPIDTEKDDLWLGEYFKKAIQRANGDILELSKEKKENRGMATTFLMCYLVEDKAYFINVGDSRAYLFRENELFQLTEDHTYVNSLVKLGVITQEEAKDHKKGHVITRALGAEKFINADFYQTNLVEGDVLLLCTDGLYGEVPEEELCKMIIKEKNMSKLAKLLVNEANELGGRDNITVVCLKVAGGNKDE